jgi:hypothetical protein
MLKTTKRQLINSRIWLPLTLSATLLAGCNAGSGDSQTSSQQASSLISMNIPDSLTGGAATSNNTMVTATAVTQQSGGDVPCLYVGADSNDPFRNGYQMTKLMVSAVATWSCIADYLIDVAEARVVPHDGTIHATKNDTTSANYNPKDPTHYSITDDSDHQTTVRLYYGYPKDAPPAMGEDPQFYISWVENTSAEVEGRMVIDGAGVNPQGHKAEDPIWARMDFYFTPDQKVADMYLRFDGGNPWADGFRIRVTKDLTANSLGHVFTAQGKIKMKAQFIPVPGVSALPSLEMYTVSDKYGNGAAVANFVDVTLTFPINNTNNLGNYLFTKEDNYAFDANGDPAWIYKHFSAATYQGGRTTPATGGTATDPSLDMISGYLWPSQPNYFDTSCNDSNTDCVDLLNTIFTFTGQDWGQEPNMGSEPADWRAGVIAAPEYLASVYPNGTDWTGAFDFSFTPTLVQ